MLDQIDAVFLDAGGVLLKPNFKRIQNLFPKLNLLETHIDEALYPKGCHVGAGLGPGDNDNQFVHGFALKAGIPEESAIEFAEDLQKIILFSEWVPRNFQEIKQCIQTLKKFNKRVVIVTNTENGLADQLLEKLMVCTEKENLHGVESVDKIIDSWVIGIHKPDERIYKYTANLIGVDINRCLHIGDSIRNDYDSALRAGAKALLFRPYDSKSHTSIQSLLDLFEKDLCNHV